MKKIAILFFILFFTNLNAKENLKFYVDKAIENNLKLNAERKNFQSSKQKKNIARSEFLPNITISGDQTSTTSTSRTDQSGTSLSDTNTDSENKTISLEQPNCLTTIKLLAYELLSANVHDHLFEKNLGLLQKQENVQ